MPQLPEPCHPERRLCFANAKHNRSRKPALSEAEGDPLPACSAQSLARASITTLFFLLAVAHRLAQEKGELQGSPNALNH